MRREQELSPARRIRLVEFVRSFHLGGTEGQVVELLRGLPPWYQLMVAVTDHGGPLLEEVWRLGHLPETFSFHGTVKQPNTAWQIARLAVWLRRIRAELIHAHDFYTALIAVPAAKLAGARVVVGRLDLAHFHTPLQRAALRWATRGADAVIANAEAIRRMLVDEERIPVQRITVIPNGIDLPRFDRRMAGPLQAPLPDLGGAPVVVHVANLAHPVKRQEDLLQAIALLRRRGIRLHAFLIGDGARRAQVEALAAQLRLKDRVHFLGHRLDVPAVLARATLGVLCSSHEGLSNAVIEGMAARLPMVVTRVGGNPDLIVDGERGFVVPPFQPEALADAVARVLADPARARTLGANGRAFVERELTLERLVNRHDRLYRAVLDGGRRFAWMRSGRSAVAQGGDL
ncbi:MAG: glycosyltransferase [Myxococcaceae bacterium]|nr:glycosyltransferase [Myxococcaceae bacterium]